MAAEDSLLFVGTTRPGISVLSKMAKEKGLTKCGPSTEPPEHFNFSFKKATASGI